VSPIAYTTDKLRELDDDTKRAWSTYSERIHELTGEEYERAEHESWEELQEELQGLERRRRSLVEGR
jgi:hypothetical protein